MYINNEHWLKQGELEVTFKNTTLARIEGTSDFLYIEFNEKDEVVKYWVRTDEDDLERKRLQKLRVFLGEYFSHEGMRFEEGLGLMKQAVKDLELFLIN